MCEEYGIPLQGAIRLIKNDYMTDTYSGPSDQEEREEWLKLMKADINPRTGEKINTYRNKETGTSIFEALDVKWREDWVS